MRRAIYLLPLLAAGCLPSARPGLGLAAEGGKAEDAGQDAGSCAILDMAPDSCIPQGSCTSCCVGNVCIPAGLSCGTGMGICNGSSCGDAGAVGQACVQGQAFSGVAGDECFFSPWTGCTASDAVCTDGGLCAHCGSPREPCCGGVGCNGEQYCDETISCNPACGAPGQPCCDAVIQCSGQQACVGGGDTPGVCTAACGAAGEPCCNGSPQVAACDEGGVCLSFPSTQTPSCQPGAPCEADAGSCTTCGNGGQACCGDGGCNANASVACQNAICTPLLHMR